MTLVRVQQVEMTSARVTALGPFLGAFLAGGVPSPEWDPIPLDTSFWKILPSCFVSSYFVSSTLGLLEWGEKMCRVLSSSQKEDQMINGV